jgi:hypothetical protein
MMRGFVFASAANVVVDAVGIGPVGLGGHRMKSFLNDEAFGDLGALMVELMCSVRRLPNQYEMGVADRMQQTVQIPGMLYICCYAPDNVGLFLFGNWHTAITPLR